MSIEGSSLRLTEVILPFPHILTICTVECIIDLSFFLIIFTGSWPVSSSSQGPSHVRFLTLANISPFRHSGCHYLWSLLVWPLTAPHRQERPLTHYSNQDSLLDPHCRYIPCWLLPILVALYRQVAQCTEPDSCVNPTNIISRHAFRNTLRSDCEPSTAEVCNVDDCCKLYLPVLGYHGINIHVLHLLRSHDAAWFNRYIGASWHVRFS